MAQSLAPYVSVPGGLKVGYAGHESNHEALLRGDIHLYADYVGTALLRYLKLAPLPRSAVYPAVKEAAWERWKIRWMPPIGFDNGYGLLMPAESAANLAVHTLSDLADMASGLTLGGAQRFLQSDPSFTFAPGGYEGFSKAYGFDFGRTTVVAPEKGETYEALARGDLDIVADFVVNPYIEALDLVALQDDRAFFAAYYAAPIVRGDFLAEYRQVGPLLERLAGKINSRQMARLNYQMEFEGQDPAEVAHAFRSATKFKETPLQD